MCIAEKFIRNTDAFVRNLWMISNRRSTDVLSRKEIRSVGPWLGDATEEVPPW